MNIKQIFNNLFKRNIKVALCCIGRLENRYILDYIIYYKKLGFDKIFLYDNNYDGEEHFEDVLQKYIKNKFVEIINYRNRRICQLNAYKECYNNHKYEYDWIAFFDIDEYITFVDNENIKQYLSNNIFNNFDCIHLNWMCYDDNNLLRYENKPLTKRFTHPSDYNINITYEFPENYHIKSIIRGNISNFNWLCNSHTPNIGLKCCNAIGIPCNDNAFNHYNYDKCYLRHYVTKTIEEWIEYKMKRGFPDENVDWFKKNDAIAQFFKVNERTEEKENIINELLNK